MIYLDSCAMVKLVLDEKETAALQRHVEDAPTGTATFELALTEVVRSVRRSCYNAQRQLRVARAELKSLLDDAHELLDRVLLITVDTDTFLRAGTFADDPCLGLPVEQPS